MTAVSLNAVEKSFGSAKVVKSINLSVNQGEFFSLLGPSGCGKTTTLRMIAGLETPTSGDIMIRGVRMNTVPINRRPTNLIFQKHALFPHLNVFENVAFGLKLKSMKRAVIERKVGEMLEVVSLSGFEKRSVNELSGGQQQRVAIARALVNEPAVLLLDEPLGALDLKLQLRLQRELRRIQRSTGITFIYVTHNQSEALTMSDRLAVMNDGRVEQVGTPAEIYLKSATSFVASFIGRTNLIEGVVEVEADTARMTDGPIIAVLDEVERFQNGERTLLSLRPERIAINPAQKMDNAIDATVAEVEFLGSTILYRMRIADGRLLFVQALADSNPYAEGASVQLGWNRDVAIFIRSTSIAEDVE
ncbi:ABC transporter ATP-binding protein [Aureimonas fodinaquatilis]|uniref:ABC transporter ATP-binding protein n=1 Tax=Aureimonas fodinaquatilis TaxID=2565783 RepID=A0A5B0E1J1_9HYPH|nr:ABC transporter ATP-binding protein [Aureimonas fodinaquatilis]KAA0971985.1 ABC transporter ATP-binding protein [Aureimonas fodinaquatilis]